MQTSQVSNPVNVLSAPAPASKQSESNAPAEPFGKVLSREVADRRNANEAPKAPEKEQSKAAPQQARNDAKPAETKSAKESKSTKETKSASDAETAETTEATDTAVDAASQASEDLLALVANLAQLNTTTAETANATQTVPGSAAATDAAAALAAGSTAKAEAPIPTATLGQTQDTDLGLQHRATPALDAMADRAGAARQQREPASTEKTELPATATADLVAKGQELLNGTSAASAGSASSRNQDFAAVMKESVNGVSPTMQPVPQAMLHAAQAATTNATERLTPSVGTPAWDQALGQKVVWMVAGGQQSATLTLNPPDLGPLQVVLNVSNSQANATFIAAQPEVRQALEAAMPKLRDMLGDAGIQLGQASVNSGTPNQQGSFDQQASQSSRNAEHAGGRADTPGVDTPVRVSRVQPAVSGQGLVDTFV